MAGLRSPSFVCGIPECHRGTTATGRTGVPWSPHPEKKAQDVQREKETPREGGVPHSLKTVVGEQPLPLRLCHGGMMRIEKATRELGRWPFG
jgi:hypothetical protein